LKTEKRNKSTISVKLTNEDHKVLSRLCALKKTSRREYLSALAKNQLKKDLLRYAVEEYSNGRASLSALATKTGLDVPTIMEEVARVTGEDQRVVEGFLSAVKAISEVNEDAEFYRVAVKALGR
jgi:formate-dependent phosphoribosylglycinamide formyltransferase (GAR transformylase)